MKAMAQLPKHVGLILDGNRRWAKQQGLPSFEGHRRGYEKVKEIGEYLQNKGIAHVSIFAFSTENWNRAQEEVDYLMDLAEWVLTEEIEEFHQRGLRFRLVGSLEGLRPKIITAIKAAEEKTARNKGGTLAYCFNYGGQQEIVDATKELLRTGARPEDVTIDSFAKHLYAPEIPPVDLMVRTAGEQRTSGFMLWRLNYAELYFSEKLWPDFTNQDMAEALTWYKVRERRFGGDSKVKSTVPPAKELVSK